jgi:RNA polymerase sigma-70 factor (ECF subfamily)
VKAVSKHKHAGLWERCIRQDAKAQLEVYDLYHTATFHTALSYLKNPMDAEEIMHEAFLTAFEKPETFRNESSLGSWLKQIVVRKCIDRLRLKIRTAEDLNEEISLEDPQDEMFWNEPEMPVILEAIQELPAGYGIILKLYLLEGYDHEEISEVLGISSSTSRSQYNRAKAKLRETLTSLGYGR